MNAMELLLTRRSVRQFTDRPIEPEKLHEILEAAMSGLCCVNAREWAFLVVTDGEKLRAMEAAVDTAAPRESRYDESCVHWNGWA